MLPTDRALVQTLRRQGYSGVQDGYFPWPFGPREQTILREAAFPEAHIRADKRYLLQPREGEEGEATTTPNRQVPALLQEGKTIRLELLVADDIEAARAEGELRQPILTVRYSFYCADDVITTRFNGRELSREEAEVTDERALTIATKLAGGMSVQAPLGFSAHWFRYRLPLDLLRQGVNTLEVTQVEACPTATFERSINGAPQYTQCVFY